MTPAPGPRTCGIATPHARATAVAADVVAAGGTAVDAAVAAAAALAVLYPHNTSVGGDLIALVRTPDGVIRCVNASGPAAAAVQVADLVAAVGPRMPTHGVHTVTVPGAVAGLGAVHRLGGRLPWARLWTDAVDLADAGAPVAPGLAVALSAAVAGIAADPGMRGVFAPAGTVLREGELLRQPALAGTLRTIADQGPAALGSGDVAAALVTGLRRLGSDLQPADLAGFRPEVVEPLHRRHRGHDVWTSPPNTQGYQLLQVLGALDHLPPDVQVDGVDAGVLAALWAEANRQRTGLLADPRGGGGDVSVSAAVAEVLSEPALRRAADRARTARAIEGPTAFAQPRGDTVAVVAADDDGYAACLIQSVFHPFGALLLEPATGILLHNRGAYFSLDPASPNHLAPGRRPGHTLMPVVVTDDRGELAWVIGTMGGKAQPQIQAQVLRRLLDGSCPAEAVAAPRWVVGGLGAGDPEDLVLVESDVPPEVQESVAARGHDLHRQPPRSDLLGHAQVVQVDGAGFTAASDPRSDGAAVVVELPGG